MSACEFDIVLYFYDEMDAPERARAAAHIRGCSACRQRLEDLTAIRDALAERPVVDALHDRAVRRHTRDSSDQRGGAAVVRDRDHRLTDRDALR